MKIYLATDHAGFQLKEQVKDYLVDKGFTVEDCGAHEERSGDDYPDFIAVAARGVQADTLHDPSLAIVFGGSGTGEAIVANRFHNVRASIYAGGDLELVKLAKEHNDANVLSIGARFTNFKDACIAIDLFLTTPFSHDERHADRILKIEEVSNQN